MLLEALQKAIHFNNRRTVAATNAASKDLRTAIEKNLAKAVAQVQPVAHHFDKGNAVDTAKNVHAFVRKNFIYLADEKKNNRLSYLVQCFILWWAIVKASAFLLLPFSKLLTIQLHLSMLVITLLLMCLRTFIQLHTIMKAMKLFVTVLAPYLIMKSPQNLVLSNHLIKYQ
jgi:hypothetical protein